MCKKLVSNGVENMPERRKKELGRRGALNYEVGTKSPGGQEKNQVQGVEEAKQKNLQEKKGRGGE